MDDLMDELYGDLDDHPSGMYSHDDEDSVDIYCGLENSPKSDGNKRKVNQLLSPRMVESMDMYEDIIREEQEEKEATYNELKQKCEAAQVQVRELLSKLQLLQTKNSSLNNENTLLKKNICSLIKTARMEIVRKDEEISRLSNRSGRGSCYGQIFHKSSLEMVQARHSLNNAACSGLERRDCRRDNITNEVNKPKGINTVLGKATMSAVTSQPFEVLQKCPRHDYENPLNCQNKNSETIQPEQESRHVHPNRKSERIKDPTTSKVADVSNSQKPCSVAPAVPSTTSDRLSSLEDNKNYPSRQVDIEEKSQMQTIHDKECNLQDKKTQKSQNVEANSSKSERTEKELIKDSSVSSETTNLPPEVPVILKSSGRSKSPSSQSHKTFSSDVSSQSSKSSPKTAANVETQRQEHTQDTNSTSKGTKHSGWKSSTSTMNEPWHSQNNKMEKRESKGHQKKDEKRQEASSSEERRDSRTERHREHERPKRDESYSRSRERRSNRSDSSKEYEQRSAKEAGSKDEDRKCREVKSKKQTDPLDSRQDPKCDSQGKVESKRKASSRTDSLLSSKKSHSHDKSKKKVFCSPDKKVSSRKYYAKVKGIHKDGDRKRDSVCEENRDEKSKNVVINKDDQKDGMISGQQCKNDQNLESIHMEMPLTVTISSSPCKTKKDNSPDRKLSFMETLNLTLSPLKNQRSSSDPREPVEETPEDLSADNSKISELGDDFLVIDELQNSQQSVEEMVEDSTTVKQHDLTSSSKQSEEVVTSEKTLAEEIDMEVQKENIAENQKPVDKVPAIITTPEKKIAKKSNFDTFSKDSSSELNPVGHFQNSMYQKCTEGSTETIDNPVVSNSLPTEMSQNLTIPINAPDSVVDGCQKQDPITTVSDEKSTIGIHSDPQPKSQDLLLAQNVVCQENVSSSDKTSSIPESSVTMEVSSSTITVDDQSMVICNAVEASTSKQDNERASDIEMSQTSENLKLAGKSHQIPLWGQTTTAASDSTTVGEETISSMHVNFSEPDSTEKSEQNLESSSTDVMLHDEDSMMLTFRNIKIIPEAISPLTSPVRQIKKVQPHRADKQPHVKSLSKDLSATTSDKVNMDMNKENESPDSSVTSASQNRTTDALLVSGTEEEELEDGEIVSESEEEGPLFIQTPPREKDKSASGSHSSPKLSSVGKRMSQKKSYAPVRYSEKSKSSVTSASSSSPTSSKRRFKTVSLSLNAAVHTSDEFMDRLASIRHELRRKYMKLHKNVTKTAFCCIVDMSQASFTEFVNAVDLGKLCHQDNNIKVKLNKIITSIMSKVTKNGIVNRIFDQKAGDLKQKLWTFVDGQFDFLFKELRAALKSSSEPSVNPALKAKDVVEKDLGTSVQRVKKARVDTENCTKETPPIKPPPRGLGSRGKNIKAVMQEDDELTEVKTSHQLPTSLSETFVLESTSENKIVPFVRRLSSNGTTQDKSDFEILTEQQASSLTFNLVSDSQMGEIFKSLLQGSDLLEPGLSVGDSQCWPVSTPRKEDVPGDSLIGIMTPNKTPFKFITSWSSISPYKFSSNSRILVDPAILDESCLLEVPSSSEPSQVHAQSTVTSQRSFSILAEDLAVSLTIPSPLKSDSHLSFLHPGTGQPLSAPNSVMSAHYSEDALDGEDPTEQDIHLSLDTDNSSCGSSPDRTWEEPDPSGFQFKPNLPMQAVVMERSNDHFIVRIRHTSTGPIESDQNEDKAEREPTLNSNLSPVNKDLVSTHEDTLDKNFAKATDSCHVPDKITDAYPPSQKSPSEDVFDDSSFGLSRDKDKQVSIDGNVTLPHVSSSAKIKTTKERVSRKRKEHHSEPKAKRSRSDKSQEKHHKSRHKRRSKSPKEQYSKSPKEPYSKSPVSPSNLSAKNVVRKKGEVVVTWTRDEDRDILVELKMKGASPKTFAALSKRLKKSTEQIEERFAQLLKLFKKKEKLEN